MYHKIRLLTKLLFLILFFHLPIQTSYAQIEVETDGRVTIGPNAHPEIKLRVENNVNTNYAYGVYGTATAGTHRRALVGYQTGGTDSYGVLGWAENGSVANLGIGGYATGTNAWAGYL